MIDVDLQVSVNADGRRFDLQVLLETDASFAVLYGPSGAGKTMTLQAIAGLLRPRRGRVRFGDRLLFDSDAGIDLPPHLRRIGYVFQDYALFPHLSVFDNVAFGLRSPMRHRLDSTQVSRVTGLLADFGLERMARSRTRELSGGQKQRVALARALACEPALLLLDEPFAALHPSLRNSLRDDLKRVRAQWGIPAIMVSHDIEDVSALANVVFVYGGGQILRRVDLGDAENRMVAVRSVGAPDFADTPRRAQLRAALDGASAETAGQRLDSSF